MSISVSTALAFHITAGTFGLLSGAGAMAFRKGSRLHRAAGNVFFVAMLAAAASGAYVGFMKSSMASVIGGVVTFYFVATAWATVMREERKVGVFEYGALFYAMALATACLTFGVEANSGNGVKDGFPAAYYFTFGGLAAFAAALDLKVIVQQGIAGAHRIARHLWRMCSALLFASASLFLGNPQVFPTFIREAQLLNVPVPLVIVLLVFWLIRVLFTNWYAQSQKADAT